MLNVWKPWYVHRPGQLLRRVARRFAAPPTDPVTVTTPWGIPLAVNPHETIGRSLWTTGIYDLAASEVLYRLARPGGWHVDVGANLGYMTALLAHRAGATGRVLAFEPHPLVATRLAENVARIVRHPGTAPVDVFPFALSDQDGESSLVEPSGFADNTGTARLANPDDVGGVGVPTRRLDGVLGGQLVQVMKVDVEGFEAAVFRGARDALAAGRIRHVLFEEHGGSEAESFGLLRDAGYALFQVGWRMSGLVLAPLDAPRVCKPYEAPNYLATLDPIAVQRILDVRGWRVLRRRAAAGSELTFTS